MKYRTLDDFLKDYEDRLLKVMLLGFHHGGTTPQDASWLFRKECAAARETRTILSEIYHDFRPPLVEKEPEATLPLNGRKAT